MISTYRFINITLFYNNDNFCPGAAACCGMRRAQTHTRAVIFTEVSRRVGSCSHSGGSKGATQVAYVALSISHEFVPVVIQTLDTWGSEGLAFLNKVGRRNTALIGDQRATSFLKQRLELAVQRGNAAAVLGTFTQSLSNDA
jgi:hypothetical protein